MPLDGGGIERAYHDVPRGVVVTMTQNFLSFGIMKGNSKKPCGRDGHYHPTVEIATDPEGPFTLVKDPGVPSWHQVSALPVGDLRLYMPSCRFFSFICIVVPRGTFVGLVHRGDSDLRTGFN